MTGDVVNLRRARKAKERAQKAEDAGRNRLVHGRTRAERETIAVETARRGRHLDGHRLANDDSDTSQ